MLLLTLTVCYLCCLYLHRYNDERCKGKAGTQALVGEADAPSQEHDDEGCNGKALRRFKGKCANKKFGRYGKRGGNKKLNYNRPPDYPTDNYSVPVLPQYVRPTSTCRKVTKKQIIRQLSVVASSCRDAQQQNQVTLAENHSLTKKVAKIKGSCGGTTHVLEPLSS